MAIYYVATTDSPGGAGNNGNAGTSAGAPWLTLVFAFGNLTAGDTLNIRGGTWTEQPRESWFGGSGSSGSRITVQANGAEIPTIQASSDQILRMTGATIQYVTFANIIWDGSTVSAGASQAYGIVLGPSSANIRFDGCEIVSTWSNGIIGEGDGHEFLNLNVEGCGRITYADYSPGANGIYYAGNNSLFEGGTYWNNRSYGVRCGDSSTSHYSSGNLIDRVAIFQNGPGKGLSGDPDTLNSPGGGVVLGDTDNTIQRSLIYNNGANGLDVFGFTGKNVERIKTYQNTFYGNTGSACVEGLFAPNAIDDEYINNIFRANGTDAVTIYSGTNSINRVETTNSAADPSFVDGPGYDFHLQSGSAVKTAGTTLAAEGVLADYDNVSLPQGAGYPIGAYAFPIVTPPGTSFPALSVAI